MELGATPVAPRMPLERPKQPLRLGSTSEAHFMSHASLYKQSAFSLRRVGDAISLPQNLHTLSLSPASFEAVARLAVPSRSQRLLDVCTVAGCLADVLLAPFAASFYEQGAELELPTWMLVLSALVTLLLATRGVSRVRRARAVAAKFMRRSTDLGNAASVTKGLERAGWLDIALSFPPDLVVAALARTVPRAEALSVYRWLLWTHTARSVVLMPLASISDGATYLRGVALMLLFILIIHILSCAWMSLARSELDSEYAPQTPVLPWACRSGTLCCRVENADAGEQAACLQVSSAGTQWVTSVYFVTQTLTTIGFGDVSAQTRTERFITVILMLLGVNMYAVIFGNITTLLQSLDRRDQHFREQRMAMSELVRRYKLSNDIQHTLASYADLRHRLAFDVEAEIVLRDLPTAVRRDVLREMHEHALRRMPIFRDAPRTLIGIAVTYLRRELILPGTVVHEEGEPCLSVIIVQSGSLRKERITSRGARAAGTVRAGEYIGLAEALSGGRFRSSLRANTFCDTYYLQVEDLVKIIHTFPEFGDQVVAVGKDDLATTETGTSHAHLTSASHLHSPALRRVDTESESNLHDDTPAQDSRVEESAALPEHPSEPKRTKSEADMRAHPTPPALWRAGTAIPRSTQSAAQGTPGGLVASEPGLGRVVRVSRSLRNLRAHEVGGPLENVPEEGSDGGSSSTPRSRHGSTQDPDHACPSPSATATPVDARLQDSRDIEPINRSQASINAEHTPEIPQRPQIFTGALARLSQADGDSPTAARAGQSMPESPHGYGYGDIDSPRVPRNLTPRNDALHVMSRMRSTYQSRSLRTIHSASTLSLLPERAADGTLLASPSSFRDAADDISIDGSDVAVNDEVYVSSLSALPGVASAGRRMSIVSASGYPPDPASGSSAHDVERVALSGLASAQHAPAAFANGDLAATLANLQEAVSRIESTVQTLAHSIPEAEAS